MNLFIRNFILVLVIFLAISNYSSAQISQGGVPLEIARVKSSELQVVDMPLVNNEFLKTIASKELENKLKPFRFAHDFEVYISPQNSGEWFILENGDKIWKCRIRSKGAKSLNLIFDNFHLPKGARLFLYNESENYYLGAFTSYNNKPSGKFAVSPVRGDEIIVQYEIPVNEKFNNDFEITRVNHDFIGILKVNDRRPLGKTAGDCNIDINCEVGESWKEIKNAVCRLIVNGKEICSGTLINNTAEDQKPYILSAGHCYDSWDLAETTIYTFNYESPYCAPLDGDPSHSISGASMRAQFENLDFALAEMSLLPPSGFRPFYVGWDRTGNIPDSTVSIHHPQGDIKKIAIDKQSPIIASYSPYVNNAFFKIIRWELGVTEAGSSGGALFNSEKHLIGTLTGGVATCSNPISDYFERFDLSWDYNTDSSQQLKYWLDPIDSGVESLAGKQFNTNENYCLSFTNLTDNDQHRLIPVSGTENKGYWGGTNNVGITEFVEQFSIYGNEQLAGISLGIGKINKTFGGANDEIKIKVYNGSSAPETMIYSDIIKLNDLDEGVMNFIGFNEIVEPAENFFVGFELSNIHAQDSFVVYQSLRESTAENFLYLKQNNVWKSFKSANENNYSAANIFELVACNVDKNANDTPLVNNPLDVLLYPNPANSKFTFEAGVDISVENISVYNLLGKQISVKFSNIQTRKVQIDLSGNIPGVYFVRFKTGSRFISRKVSFVPW